MLKERELAEAADMLDSRREVSVLERVAPVLGGTVTEVLERLLSERLRAIRLFQRTSVCAQPVPALMLGTGESMLERRVLLRGATTSTPVLYAESLIAVDRLDPRVRQGLLATDQPIGRLIGEYRVEVFREMLSCERVRSAHAAMLLGLPPDQLLLARSYRMLNRGRPIMVIAEWFPC
jgi:chorismate-pyruvate lyase